MGPKSPVVGFLRALKVRLAALRLLEATQDPKLLLEKLMKCMRDPESEVVHAAVPCHIF